MDISGNGPSRWKQWAFYDYLKDLSVVILKVPVVRLSIWDQVLMGDKNCLVKDVLKKPVAMISESLIKLIETRQPVRHGRGLENIL